MSSPLFGVTPPVLGASGATEAGISAGQAGSAAAALPAMVGIVPLVADPASVAFADALLAAGSAYAGAVGEHAVQRSVLGSAQGVMATTFEVTETSRAAAAALGNTL